MIKILYDHQIFSMQRYGGISRYFANLHHEFSLQKNVRSSIGVLESHNCYLPLNRKPLSRIIRNTLHSPLPLYAENEWYSKRLIKQNSFSVFHPTYYNPYFLPLLKKPFVITVHDLIHELFPHYFSPEEMRDAAWKKLLVENASHIIAISQSTKTDLQRMHNVAEEKVTVVYHGYNAMATAAHTQEPPVDNYILFVGERIRYKNFLRLLSVFHELAKDDAGLNLVCAGGGEFKANEVEKINQYQLSGKVFQISANEAELAQLYRCARLFVFPSLYEGFGFGLLEAFANGCAVAASNTSCFKEVGGDAVAYFNPDDEAEMKNVLSTVLNNQSLAEDLKQRGHQQLQNFSMEKCAEATLEVYKKVALNKAPKRSSNISIDEKQNHRWSN